ncbi:MAG: hypothetical protein A2885_13475 [Sphingopyxis sp. RIFCSPHIGHO2_01_FULL_65_24]|nr:MAG: hypothetical protein A2885_13475 [Sphingopyxis sp. RIFCSPHIGHO2_01_FULL_65_24]
MNLHWMALSLVLIAALGLLWGRHGESTGVFYVAIFAALILIMARGYYWNIFGQGEGFWTLNRMSAVAALLVVLSMCRKAGEGQALHDRQRRQEPD